MEILWGWEQGWEQPQDHGKCEKTTSVHQTSGTRGWEVMLSLLSAVIQRQSSSLLLEGSLQWKRSRDALQRAWIRHLALQERHRSPLCSKPMGWGPSRAPWVQLRAGICESQITGITSTPQISSSALGVIPEGVGLMTSLSGPISCYLHNDSLDLNSPQSFGSLHHPFLPALLCHNLLLSSTLSSPVVTFCSPWCPQARCQGVP